MTDKNKTSRLIYQAQQACDSLLTILKEENKSLISGDITKLSQLSDKKTELLSQLDTYKDSITPDCPGITKNKWNYFLASLEKCQRLNNKNGYIINTSLNNTKTSISILRGNSQQETSTYTNNGYTSESTNTRTIAKI